MTPRELFERDPHEPRWIHGSDIGVDQDGGLWVRAEAKLEKSAFGLSMLFRDIRPYAILMSNMVVSYSPKDPTAPIEAHVKKLATGSIGSDWIAVN